MSTSSTAASPTAAQRALTLSVEIDEEVILPQGTYSQQITAVLTTAGGFHAHLWK